MRKAAYRRDEVYRLSKKAFQLEEGLSLLALTGLINQFLKKLGF